MTTVFLNGQFLPLEDAKVSVLDRGFLFADGVYEGIPVFGGKLFRLEQHLTRLQRSLDAIQLPLNWSSEQWKSTLNELIERNGGGDQSCYLQVTRGPAQRDHLFPTNITPTVFAMCNPLPQIDPATISAGLSAVTVEDIRWQRCDIKAVSLLGNVLMKQEAAQRGADEAILTKEGLAYEGAASNLFVVKDGQIVTPPKNNHILGGVTRDLVLELAEQHQLSHAERQIPIDELAEVEEIWLTSSTREIRAITQLNHQPVGSGQPGPVYQQMIQIYQDFKRSFCA